MRNFTTRRRLLGPWKHLLSSIRPSKSPSSPLRPDQFPEYQRRRPKTCAKTAGKDCVHRHFHKTLGSVRIPRTKPAASDATPAENTQDTGERVLNISPHGALGCLALTSATLVASTPTSSSGSGRLGDGGRGASETVCVKERVPFIIGVGRRLRSTRILRSRSWRSRGSRGSGRRLRFCRGDLECPSNT